MDIIVSKEEFFRKVQEAPYHPRYKVYIADLDPEGEMSFNIDTDNDHDVYIRMIFQYDVDTEGNLHFYTNGLDDVLRDELLTYFKELNISYETE